MSDFESGKNRTLKVSGRARRLFLKDTVLATAAASAAAFLPVAGRPAAVKAAGHCPQGKTPMQEVQGKVAFITGGTSGIGLGIAKAFVGAGMKVVIGGLHEDRTKEALTQFAAAGQTDRVHGINVDVADRPSMERAAAETVEVFGKVHVLVNNAGVIIPPTLSATSYKDWDWLMGVNLNGPFNGIHVFLPLIRSHGEGGQIITTSSVMGLFASSNAGAYTVSKFAVIGMMEALRAELAEGNIGASVFCPGTVTSNIEETSRRDRPKDSGSKDDREAARRQTQQRPDRDLFMDPVEVGQLVLRGMRNNDLYILTHPEYEPIMRERNEALIASIPRDLHPPEARVAMVRSWMAQSGPIYVAERDRERCAQAGHAQKAG